MQRFCHVHAYFTNFNGHSTLLSSTPYLFNCAYRATSLSYCVNVPQDPSLWPTIVLAFKTLGVVYGDMGTSPLYVFADVFSKVPIGSDDDVLGALSLVMYTIALIPLAKYVFIVLKANDNGECNNNIFIFPLFIFTLVHFKHVVNHNFDTVMAQL